MSAACLQTTIKNVSAVTQICSFLPPHGRKLAAGEELAYDGDLVSQIGAKPSGTRDLASLMRAIDDGVLRITSTPAPQFKDPTLGLVKTISIDNGAVVVGNPCTGSVTY